MTATHHTTLRDDQIFLGLRQRSPGQWQLPVDVSICSGTGRMFGGAGSAALAAAFELSTGRQLKVMHVQFLRSAASGDDLSGSVSTVEVGRTTHARLTFSGKSDPVLRATALLGEAEGVTGVERATPEVLSPERCEPREYMFPLAGSLNERLDIRIAGYPAGPLPRAVLWVRAPWRQDSSVSSLALVADHVPFALAHAPGTPIDDPVVTVDSSIRVLQPPDTEWLLVDARVDSIGDRFAVGTVDVWTEDMRLVAIGGQTTSRVRAWSSA